MPLVASVFLCLIGVWIIALQKKEVKRKILIHFSPSWKSNCCPKVWANSQTCCTEKDVPSLINLMVALKQKPQDLFGLLAVISSCSVHFFGGYFGQTLPSFTYSHTSLFFVFFSATDFHVLPPPWFVPVSNQSHRRRTSWVEQITGPLTRWARSCGGRPGRHVGYELGRAGNDHGAGGCCAVC